MSNTTALYRHFNQSGDLLYVGISKSAIMRLGQHMHGSSWAQEIARVDVEHLPSREEALKAEKLAIESERPRWNKIHNRQQDLNAVKSSRELMRASHGLTLAGERLLALCLTRTDLRTPVVVDAEEVMNSFPRYRDDRAVYGDLRKAAEDLGTGHAMLEDGRELKWATAEYSRGEAYVSLSPEVVQILESSGGRVCYPLSDVGYFSSTYPWRVLEVIKAGKSISVENFRHATDAPTSCRVSFKDLRKRIIDPAIREMNRGPIKVSYRPLKVGRRVARLEFSFAKIP